MFSPTMGQIVIQPQTVDSEDLEAASLVIFPERIEKKTFNVAVEWAAGTQTPIFCHGADISRFEAEGFGAYRFHRLDGYKEIDFQGGSLEFFPARRRKSNGIKGWTGEMSKWLGLGRISSFHLAIRPKNEGGLLYLSSSYINSAEWQTLSKMQPEQFIGSEALPRHEWLSLSTAVRRKILSAHEIHSLTLVPRGQGRGTIEQNAESAKHKEASGTWVVKAASV